MRFERNNPVWGSLHQDPVFLDVLERASTAIAEERVRVEASGLVTRIRDSVVPSIAALSSPD